MKKILLLAVTLLSTVLLPAQGVYQLWGMTPGGGNDNAGTIFKMDARGNNFQLVHQFGRTNSGATPFFSELTRYNGKFYSMTSEGGINNAGVIFEWDPTTNLYSKKFDFGGLNGEFPRGSLTLYNGKFYGITSYGGTVNYGVIFEWDPVTNIYLKKIDFDLTNGGGPISENLVLYNGKFYATTWQGGNYNHGVIFEWDPLTNIYLKKFDFDGNNGNYPIGNLVLSSGKFYGMTFYGGINDKGVIFEWDPATNTFIKKIDLTDGNGSHPAGSLTASNGKFYGMTELGGTDNEQSGVIFEWDPATNVYTKKFDFNPTSGKNPYGNLIPNDGKFYGITFSGGSNDGGVIFEWDPVSNIYAAIMEFSGPSGSNPTGSLTKDAGKWYGMTSRGGANSAGVIFEWNPVSNLYTKKIDLSFNNIDVADNGRIPYGNLTYSKGRIYGMTQYGGSNNSGAIFELDPATNAYSKKLELDGINSSGPAIGLTQTNGKFYGITHDGGANSVGTIFEWNPLTNIYTKKFDFGAENGAIPTQSLLTPLAGKLYGVTFAGGSNDLGILFEWDPLTNNFIKKFDFEYSSGSHPSGSLVVSNGKFYGTTWAGGANNLGVIYEWNPVTNIYTKKLDIGWSGGILTGNRLAIANNKFYGLSLQGGNSNTGVIFEWDPTSNLYLKKIDLDSNKGQQAFGSLMLSNDKFYGLTYSGGDGNKGVIFEYDPVTNSYTKKKDFAGADGANPTNDLTLVPAPVSGGLPGSCKTFPTVTINSTNNNQWVSITDEDGNAVAEIKANGNNLGTVNTSMFINNTAVREDATKRLYLDRNITITPQFQPTTSVDVRLYIKASEYLALKNAVNSNGQSAGIESISDITLYKVSGSCSPAVSTLTNKVTTTAAAWEADYVFTASITSFSSFYFAGKATICSAPVISQVNANPNKLWPPNHQFKNVTVSYNITGTCTPITSWLTVSSNEPLTGTGCGDIAPDWIIVNNHHLKLRAERSGHGNGRIYTICIHVKDAAGNMATQKTRVTVPHNQGCSNSKGIYSNDGYIDANGDYFDQWFECSVTPNPSSGSFNLQVATASNDKIEVSILDVSGRLINKFNTVKNQSLHFGDELKNGVYMVIIKQGQQQQIIKVVKQ